MAQMMINLNLEEDFEGGALHKPNTLVVTLSGPQTNKATYSWIASALAASCHIDTNSISSIYRLEDPRKYYVKLTDAGHIRHYKDLHGKRYDFPDNKISILIEHLDKEKSKGHIHWLPWTTKTATVQRIATTITGDMNAEVYPIKAAGDVWTFTYKPQKNIDIPHYVTAKISSETEADRHIKMFVALPGRRTPCSVCGDTSHWTSQCPKRRQRQEQQQQQRQQQQQQQRQHREEEEKAAPEVASPTDDPTPTRPPATKEAGTPADQRGEDFTVVASNKKKRRLQDKKSPPPPSTRPSPQKMKADPPKSPKTTPTRGPRENERISLDNLASPLPPPPTPRWADLEDSPEMSSIALGLELSDSEDCSPNGMSEED